MASVRLEDVHKTYPNGHEAAKGIDLEIAEGELMVLVGPSGCGKSTALRMVAGLETPTRGRIWIGDRDVTNVRVQDRDVAMVFQNYALYPHKSVRGNLAFALELQKTTKSDVDRRVAEVARALGLDALLDRKPRQLSGGQRQRVALGRAIVREPRVFLFDEPLSNLDAKLRVQTRAELMRLHRRLGATMIYVTHDQEEAMTLGDRIAVLHEGLLQQCAPPLEVYRTPANAFVAGFVGSPSMNFLECGYRPEGDRLRIEGQGWSLMIDALPALSNGAQPRRVLLGVRPQDVEIVGSEAAELTARVDVIERLGSESLVHLDLAGADFRVLTSSEVGIVEDDVVGLHLPAPEPVQGRSARLHFFDAQSGARLN
jgi:multiple sugar transport system ATP-binding protein